MEKAWKKVDIGMLAAFWAVSFALVMTPGADWAYAISAGMQDKVIIPAISGMLLGYLMITIVVAAGVGAVVASVPAILDVLTIVGAGYLLWLGLSILRNPPVPTAGLEADTNVVGWVIRGFGISGMNPKALLLFLALLPQFTSRTASWSIAGQITVMGGVQIINCALVYSLVAVGSRAVLRTRPRAARLVSQISGSIMMVIAFVIIVERFMS